MGCAWPKDSREALAMRERLRHDRVANLLRLAAGQGASDGTRRLVDSVGQADPELTANAMICAVHQAVFLLKRQIESQGRRFLKEGGFAENMYRQRQKARQRRAAEKSDRSDQSDRSDKSGQSDRSDSSDKPDAPRRNSP